MFLCGATEALQLWISQSCSWAKYMQSSLICSISPQAAHPAVWTNCLEMSSSSFIWHYLPFCLGHWFPCLLCLKTHIIHQFLSLPVLKQLYCAFPAQHQQLSASEVSFTDAHLKTSWMCLKWPPCLLHNSLCSASFCFITRFRAVLLSEIG